MYTLEQALASVGPGWSDLVRRCWNECRKYPSVRIMNVKEKLGGLRFYISHSPEDLFDVIERYMEESRWVCETCGEEGRLRDGVWMKTRCDRCQKKWEREVRRWGRERRLKRLWYNVKRMFSP